MREHAPSPWRGAPVLETRRAMSGLLTRSRPRQSGPLKNEAKKLQINSTEGRKPAASEYRGPQARARELREIKQGRANAAP